MRCGYVIVHLVAVRVIGDGFTTERFHVGQVPPAPHWGVRVLLFVADAYEIDLAESGN